jgi:PAS domain S-box-containing protein
VGRVLVVCGLVYAIRSVALYQQSFLDTYYFQSDWRESVFLVVVMVMFVLLTYAIGLMVNHRLLMRVGMEREKFAKAFNASPQAIILSRLEDGHILEVNQGFTRIFGIPSHEATGRTSMDLGIWPNAEERTVVMDAVKKDRHVENLNATWRGHDGVPIHGVYSGAIIDLDGTTCLISVITDITAQLNQQHEREKLLAERENALAEIHVLSGLLPICASCKKIRDDQGYWNQLESYIQKHSNAEFTHGICPECMRHLYADYLDDPKPEKPST